MSIVLFPVNILLHLCIRFPPLKVHGVDVYILYHNGHADEASFFFKLRGGGGCNPRNPPPSGSASE